LHFKRIEADLSAYFLCRTINDSRLVALVNGMYSDEMLCAENKELFDYSTNLLGVFLPQDSKIVLIGDNRKHFYAYWDFAEEVSIPVFGQDFEIDEHRDCFFFPVSSLHQKIRVPFQRPPKDSDEILTAHVVHTPTRSNYWHFSVCWKDEKGDFEKYKGSAWQKRISSTMLAYLQEHILLETPNYLPLSASVYVNDSQ